MPAGRDQPLWWTLRRPLRALNYPPARAMFTRANAVLGSNWSLHDLRHSAAYRTARDPLMSWTDVQWVLGHAHLSTTQIYVTAPVEDVIAAVLAHHERRTKGPVVPAGQGSDRLSYRPGRLRSCSGGQASNRCRAGGWRCCACVASGSPTSCQQPVAVLARACAAASVPASSAAEKLVGDRAAGAADLVSAVGRSVHLGIGWPAD